MLRNTLIGRISYVPLLEQQTLLHRHTLGARGTHMGSVGERVRIKVGLTKMFLAIKMFYLVL